MKSDDYIDGTKAGETVILGGWNQPIKAFPTVEIPLDEYREFVEFKIKGETVEIPLGEYNELRDSNMQMDKLIYDLEKKIIALDNQLENEKKRYVELEAHAEVVTKKTAYAFVEMIMKDILKLSQEQIKEIRTKWDNGEM